MSNNKQSRIYQCVRLLSQGVNNLDIQNTIINAYEKVVRKNDALKEHIEEMILDLQDKKKIISNLEDEISEQNNNWNRYKELVLTYANLDYKLKVLSRWYKNLEEENKTLKETNINLLEISKGYQEELAQQSNYIGELKEYIEDSAQDLQHYKEKYSKLKTKVNAIYGNSLVLGDISLEEASNPKQENEKLKQKIKDLDMKILKESLNKAMWHNTYEADIQALKGNLDCTDEMNTKLKEENEKLKQGKNKALFYLKKYISNTLVFSSCVDNAIKALE